MEGATGAHLPPGQAVSAWGCPSVSHRHRFWLSFADAQSHGMRHMHTVCHRTDRPSAYPPAVAAASALASAACPCRCPARSYYWFALALEFVALAGLTVLSIMGLLAASSLSWMAWFTVLALLTIQVGASASLCPLFLSVTETLYVLRLRFYIS